MTKNTAPGVFMLNVIALNSKILSFMVSKVLGQTYNLSQFYRCKILYMIWPFLYVIILPPPQIWWSNRGTLTEKEGSVPLAPLLFVHLSLFSPSCGLHYKRATVVIYDRRYCDLYYKCCQWQLWERNWCLGPTLYNFFTAELYKFS